jgi:hypothetical protein
MIINNGPIGAPPVSSLELFEAPALSTSMTSTTYGPNPLYNLTYTQPSATQSFANPRIEAPQYINYSLQGIRTVPVWLQYVINTANSPPLQSLIYWNGVPNNAPH